MSLASRRRLILLGLLLAIGTVLGMVHHVFFNISNLMTILQQGSLTGIVAIGFTLVMITAGIDMSIGAVIAVTSMVAVNFLSYTKIPVPVFLAISLLVGALVGLVNGFFITRFKLPEFIVTLAMRGILSGIALMIAVRDSTGFLQNVYIQDPTYLWFGGQVGPVYLVAVAFIILAFFTQVFMKRTRAGTNIYASGANPNAARLSGINTNRTIIGVYIFSGVCASISAIFLSSQMMTAMPDLGIGTEMDVIAAVVIGGTPFTGGVGDVWGTVIGAIFLALLKNGITMLGISPWIQPIAVGGVIVLAVIADVWYKDLADAAAARAARRKRDAAIDGNAA
jgi:ribose/xylose/arabinose/galactoside ABC-type transport system permease subunit